MAAALVAAAVSGGLISNNVRASGFSPLGPLDPLGLPGLLGSLGSLGPLAPASALRPAPLAQILIPMKHLFITLAAYCLLTLNGSGQTIAQDKADSIPHFYTQENAGIRYALKQFAAPENLPVCIELPDALEGVKDFSDWQRRRNEIGSLIQHYGIGTKPAVDPSQVKARMEGDTMLVVDVTVNGQTLTLQSHIRYPKTGQPPYALMIGTDMIALPRHLFDDRPIATMNFRSAQVNDYKQWGKHHDRGDHPFDRLYPELKDNGAYSEWAWGMSRLIDGLQQLGPDVTKIDTRRIGVTGCSYAGKMALYCGAFDERIALTIAQEPGGGGAAVWRKSHELTLAGKNLEDIDKTDYHWFLESQKDNFHGDSVYRLPYDQHELCAMVCPRALLLLGNPDYEWLADSSMSVSAQAAHKVWEHFGIPDRMACDIVGGHGHCQLPQSQYPIVQDYIDRFLLTSHPASTPGGSPSGIPASTPGGSPSGTDFIKGADVGFLAGQERHGVVFHDRTGKERECLELLKNDFQISAVRLRVWVDPRGGDCDKHQVLAMAQRAKALGMDIMIDFHYADSWADPGKQPVPKAWQGHSYKQMRRDLRDHTIEVLSLLKQNDITPRWVQVGNETSNGLLWDMGHIEKHPKQYAGFIREGYKAVKKIFPKAIVIVHLDRGHSQSLYDYNLGIVKKYGGKFDMVGMSLYPYWARQDHPELDPDSIISDCIRNIRHVSQSFGCDVMIVETGFEVDEAHPEVMIEGRRQLQRVVSEARTQTGNRCRGVFYWEPQCLPGGYRLGAFDRQGTPTAIMDGFVE